MQGLWLPKWTLSFELDFSMIFHHCFDNSSASSESLRLFYSADSARHQRASPDTTGISQLAILAELLVSQWSKKWLFWAQFLSTGSGDMHCLPLSGPLRAARNLQDGSNAWQHGCAQLCSRKFAQFARKPSEKGGTVLSQNQPLQKSALRWKWKFHGFAISSSYRPNQELGAGALDS